VVRARSGPARVRRPAVVSADRFKSRSRKSRDRASAAAGGVTHFVVIAGKDGFDYLVRDPGAGAAKGLYPLRELGSDIEALRFYEPIPNANSQSQRNAEQRPSRPVTSRQLFGGHSTPANSFGNCFGSTG